MEDNNKGKLISKASDYPKNVLDALSLIAPRIGTTRAVLLRTGAINKLQEHQGSLTPEEIKEHGLAPYFTKK